MKIRLISGSCYVALLVAFYCLKIFVHDFFFDALLYAISLLGTYELLRALKDKTTSTQRCVTFAFSMIALPVVALAEYFLGGGMAAIGVCFMALAVVMMSLLVVRHEETSLESLGVALLSAVYPTLFLALMTLANHAQAPLALEKSPELARTLPSRTLFSQKR